MTTSKRKALAADPTIDAIADWIFNNAPTWGVDALLCHPEEAMEMAIDVATAGDRLTAAEAKRLRKILNEMAALPEAMAVVSEVLAEAMGARKRGLIRKGGKR